MSLKYDLHAHSTASDGTLTPRELVSRAVTAGIDVLALTDHDTTDGVSEAQTEADRIGLELVPGVEVSVTWQQQTVHILGLQLDPGHSTLQEGLKQMQSFRNWRAQEIGRRLEKAGIPGGFARARELAVGKLISRTHFARFLVESGHAPDQRKVFSHYLVRGKPGYVPGQWADLDQAVRWIRKAGGQAVVAHPARYPFTRTKLRRLLGEFREVGGVGMEVISGSHSRDDCFAMARHARELGLLGSLGSDYHGPENPWIELGRLPPLPEGCEPVWSLWPLPQAPA